MDPITDVVQSSASDLIIFFTILAGVLTALTIPLYKVVTSNSQKKRNQDFKEQKLIVDVIKGNSEVLTQLKVVLENTNSNCVICKQEQLEQFNKLAIRQTGQTILLTKIEEQVKSLL